MTRQSRAGAAFLISLVLLLTICLLSVSVQAFQPVGVGTTRTTTKVTSRLHMNFFKNILGQAFANDISLTQDVDKRRGQIDGAEVDDDDAKPVITKLTATQQKWRQQQLAQQQVQPTDLQGSSISLDLYLTGVANKDPSNDLFGSRVNIVSRDRTIGLTVPDQPTVSSVQLEFQPDGKCTCLDPDNSGFVNSDQPGDWILAPNGKQVRFRFAVTGYTRRVDTKGTIQKVFWSAEDDKVSQTSTIYSIPAGWLYGEADLSLLGGNNKNTGNAEEPRPPQQVRWDNCFLKVEQAVGMLGVASKMTPCGKFTVSYN